MANGLEFIASLPPVEAAPTRVDVACFIGLIDYRGAPWSEPKNEWEERKDHWSWMRTHGWLSDSKAPITPFHRESAKTLLDVPIPIENFGAFDELFVWDKRGNTGIDAHATTYLGAAVRSFFANGGRKCYVVRVDKPLPINATRAERLALIPKLIPGYPGSLTSNKSDRASWHGIGHLFGLSDVSFVCLPDLPELVATDQVGLPTDPPSLPELPEQFVECSDPMPAPPPDNAIARYPAPRCDKGDYSEWKNAIEIAGNFVARHRREVQLVAAIPLPVRGSEPDGNLYEYFVSEGWLPDKPGSEESESERELTSPFIQLTYPWIRTRGSSNLPERLEPSDAALIGLLSENALLRGTFRSISGISTRDVLDVEPPIPQQLIHHRKSELAFSDRASLFAPTVDGITIISDVTTSSRISYRPAPINRLIGLIIRAARLLGEDLAFESSGERLWNRIRLRLADVLLSLYNSGALRGASAREAFQVRCDRSTMTQHDIDSGRVIAHVVFSPAAPIERIQVILTLDRGDQVPLAKVDVEIAA